MKSKKKIFEKKFWAIASIITILAAASLAILYFLGIVRFNFTQEVTVTVSPLTVTITLVAISVISFIERGLKK